MSKDIIRMAREAGFPGFLMENPVAVLAAQRFSDLIRADERGVIADLLEHGYTDDEGHHIQYAEEIRRRNTSKE